MEPSREASTRSPVLENFEPGFRRDFILRFSLALAVVFGTWSAFLYFALERDFGNGYGVAFFSLLHVRRELSRYVLYSTLVQATILAILAAAMTLFFSHKIAGPVFRIRVFLRAWRKGEKAPGGMRLRKGDQVQRFASSVELSFTELAGRCHRTAAKAEALAARIEAGEAVSRAELDELRRVIEQLKVG